MAIYSGFSHKKMVIFHSYVKLPEGKLPHGTSATLLDTNFPYYVFCVMVKSWTRYQYRGECQRDWYTHCEDCQYWMITNIYKHPKTTYIRIPSFDNGTYVFCSRIWNPNRFFASIPQVWQWIPTAWRRCIALRVMVMRTGTELLGMLTQELAKPAEFILDIHVIFLYLNILYSYLMFINDIFEIYFDISAPV